LGLTLLGAAVGRHPPRIKLADRGGNVVALWLKTGMKPRRGVGLERLPGLNGWSIDFEQLLDRAQVFLVGLTMSAVERGSQ